MPYIYESPDGGNTVYQREFNIAHRELTHVKNPELIKADQRKLRFTYYIDQAITDPELDHMLEQIEIYTSLKNTP